jgi:hypothetical protein
MFLSVYMGNTQNTTVSLIKMSLQVFGSFNHHIQSKMTSSVLNAWGAQRLSARLIRYTVQRCATSYVLVGSAGETLQHQCSHSSIKQGREAMPLLEYKACMIAYKIATLDYVVEQCIPIFEGALEKRGYNGVKVRILTLPACVQRKQQHLLP